MNVPMPPPTSTDVTATNTDRRAPLMMPANTSKPSCVVPKKWPGLNGPTPNASVDSSHAGPGRRSLKIARNKMKAIQTADSL